MNIINIPVPTLSTYNKSEIIRNDPEIYTSGMSALMSSSVKGDAWYCQITNERSLQQFDITTLMGDDVVQRVMNGSLYLVIDLSFEPFYRCIDSIYDHVICKHNIPEKQVIFVSNMFNVNEYIVPTAQRYGKEPIKSLWFPSLEYMLRYTFVEPGNTLQPKEYPKKFLNLNRRWRGHRPLLTLLLHHKNLLNKGYVSFGPCENHNGWDEIWDGLKASVKDHNEMYVIVTSSESVKLLPPLYLDTNELHTNRAELTDSTTKYYEDTYFSVVSETTFYHRDKNQNSVFLTEKTFKAIAMKHPFVLVTIPKSLEVLKKLGYKTFSPWIDETYDQEMDDNTRMLKILAEIDRLCNLSEEQLAEFLVAAREICEFNFNLLKARTNFIYDLCSPSK